MEKGLAVLLQWCALAARSDPVNSAKPVAIFPDEFRWRADLLREKVMFINS